MNLFAGYKTPGTGVSWTLNDLVTNSGGVVTFSSGNYFVNGDSLKISASDTLKILSNATVKLALNSVFHIRGVLIINPADSVKFTSTDTTQKFSELRIDTSSATSLNKLIFEYSMNGLRVFDCNPLLNNCSIRYNGNGASTTSGAIVLFRSNAVIQNSRIYRNYHVAVSGGSNIANAPQILYNQIYENNISNGNVPQINLGQSGSGTTVIRGNTITGGNSLQTGGIATLAIGTLSLVIESNIIKNNRYGITVQNGGTAIIRNNTIDSNRIQNSPNLGGSGINLVGSAVTAIVSKNFIRWNLWGITTQTRSNLVLGDLSSSDTNYIGLNQIYGNNNTGIFYDLYNNTINPIKAENNYWGTTIVDSVEAHIFHQPDNDSGLVDYLPIWTTVGISPVSSEIPGSFMLHDAYPNPFNPATNIRFDIAAAENVRLSVYDILGREVASLVNEKLNAGRYDMMFNASGLSSGIYFYTLKSGSFNQSKRLVLVK